MWTRMLQLDNVWPQINERQQQGGACQPFSIGRPIICHVLFFFFFCHSRLARHLCLMKLLLKLMLFFLPFFFFSFIYFVPASLDVWNQYSCTSKVDNIRAPGTYTYFTYSLYYSLDFSLFDFLFFLFRFTIKFFS